ncbi:helix-turn-helix domain-containing protein [Psychrobacillus sp. NEAU-3TGS]|uniref:AraC family transcriptional regulator n=1 Tax=Psychrobacillus sp. NEAU-3TGS TaxID=2995412 RepID=UPI002495E7AB|nr:helix-turn-helix domain-containing protein [Psychrobacillus sp. NEAU-3TGS]MDI2585624.1 helix-turn-helix domain-containing protein [Psychrobacillus sp. NEAU-3TGS]
MKHILEVLKKENHVMLDSISFSHYQNKTSSEFKSSEPEILFVLEGSLTYQIGEDESRPLKVGEYVFYPQGVNVRFEIGKMSSTLLFPLSISITEQFVHLLQQHHQFSPSLLENPNRVCILQEPWTVEINSLLQKILVHLSKNQPYFVHLALLEIMAYIFPNEHMLSKITYVLDHYLLPDPIRNAESYILQNYHQPIRMKQLTEVTNVSESQLNRMYQRAFQLTPMERVATIRMEQAAQLLRNPSQSVTNVALQVGYQSMSAFLQQFKKKYGVSPKEYQIKTTAKEI